MLIVCIMIVLIIAIICATVLLYKAIEEYDLRDILLNYKKIMTVKKMICQKAEVGDRFSDEEIRVMYELLTKK